MLANWKLRRRARIQRETDLYTPLERKLLEVKPGITDFASIVFSDEGDILKDVADPDISYNQLIRPGKGYLGLFYIDNKSIWLDIRLCFYTVIAILSKEKALKGITSILQSLDANDELLVIAQRAESLRPMPPPGGSRVVTSRDGNPNI